jgi:hypothetical protein
MMLGSDSYQSLPDTPGMPGMPSIPSIPAMPGMPGMPGSDIRPITRDEVNNMITLRINEKAFNDWLHRVCNDGRIKNKIKDEVNNIVPNISTNSCNVWTNNNMPRIVNSECQKSIQLNLVPMFRQHIIGSTDVQTIVEKYLHDAELRINISSEKATNDIKILSDKALNDAKTATEKVTRECDNAFNRVSHSIHDTIKRASSDIQIEANKVVNNVANTSSQYAPIFEEHLKILEKKDNERFSLKYQVYEATRQDMIATKNEFTLAKNQLSLEKQNYGQEYQRLNTMIISTKKSLFKTKIFLIILYAGVLAFAAVYIYNTYFS